MIIIIRLSRCSLSPTEPTITSLTSCVYAQSVWGASHRIILSYLSRPPLLNTLNIQTPAKQKQQKHNRHVVCMKKASAYAQACMQEHGNTRIKNWHRANCVKHGLKLIFSPCFLSCWNHGSYVIPQDDSGSHSFSVRSVFGGNRKWWCSGLADATLRWCQMSCFCAVITRGGLTVKAQRVMSLDFTIIIYTLTFSVQQSGVGRPTWLNMTKYSSIFLTTMIQNWPKRRSINHSF